MATILRILGIGGFLFTAGCLTATTQSREPSARTILFQDTERTYYIALPQDFNPDHTYWPMVVVHGGGGNAQTNTKALAMRQFADELDLPAILILPQFITKDKL